MKELKGKKYNSQNDKAGCGCSGHSHDHHDRGEGCCGGKNHVQDSCCSKENDNGGHSNGHEGGCGCKNHKDGDSGDDDDAGASCSCCSTAPKGKKKENKYVTYGLLAISLVSLVLGHMEIGFFGINVSIIATLICGAPIVVDAVRNVFSGFKITTNLLITIAIIAAISIGELFAAAEVAFIMVIGEMLEEYTLKKANKGLSALISYAPKIAHLVSGKDVIAKDLKVDDVVLVKNGESIPVDGVILEGSSSIDQTMVTGESEPVYKVVDDMVYEGTVNGEGALTIKATRSGRDSTLSRMIELVKKAQREKAKAVKITDRMAKYIVPISVVTAIAVYAFTGEIVRAVTILVVFCPCALVLSMPTAIMACIGRATKMGVLIKSGQGIENLWKIDTIVTDKTGTLTEGKMSVAAVIGQEESVVRAAAMAESMSAHPIAKAVVNYAKTLDMDIEKGQDFRNVSGKGIVCGNIAAGNDKLMAELSIPIGKDVSDAIIAWKNDGCSSLYVAQDNVVIGAIAIRDQVRESVKAAVAKMTAMGVKSIMATGDKQKFADIVGKAVGVSQVRANLLPEEKVGLVEQLQAAGAHVAMVGDGVNDAPALAKANVGIAMGAIGSDVAIETADVALMNDEIANVPRAIALAKKTRNTVVVNITASILLSLFAVVFASTGDIGPVAGALIHNLGAIVVVLNSIWLFYKRV